MMMRIALVCFTLMLSVQAVLGAESGFPALRSEATVTGDVVRVGDLVTNAGPIADIPIFRAPALGETGTVSAEQVIQAIKLHAMIRLDAGNVTTVTVTRASRAIPAKQIESGLAATIAATYNLGNPSHVAITFDRPLRGVQVERTVTAAPQFDDVYYDEHTTRFSAVLSIPGAPDSKRTLTGTAVATTEAVALTHPLARGDVITMGAITLQRVPRSEVSADTITDPDQVIGLAARVPLANGALLSANKLMKPRLVQRSDTVTLIYQVPGVMLSVRGKALDSGSEGDLVDVVNIQSNRTVRGTIVGPGQVRVASLTARVAVLAQASTVGAGASFAK